MSRVKLANSIMARAVNRIKNLSRASKTGLGLAGLAGAGALAHNYGLFLPRVVKEVAESIPIKMPQISIADELAEAGGLSSRSPLLVTPPAQYFDTSYRPRVGRFLDENVSRKILDPLSLSRRREEIRSIDKAIRFADKGEAEKLTALKDKLTKAFHREESFVANDPKSIFGESLYDANYGMPSRSPYGPDSLYIGPEQRAMAVRQLQFMGSNPLATGDDYINAFYDSVKNIDDEVLAHPFVSSTKDMYTFAPQKAVELYHKEVLPSTLQDYENLKGSKDFYGDAEIPYSKKRELRNLSDPITKFKSMVTDASKDSIFSTGKFRITSDPTTEFSRLQKNLDHTYYSDVKHKIPNAYYNTAVGKSEASLKPDLIKSFDFIENLHANNKIPMEYRDKILNMRQYLDYLTRSKMGIEDIRAGIASGLIEPRSSYFTYGSGGLDDLSVVEKSINDKARELSGRAWDDFDTNYRNNNVYIKDPDAYLKSDLPKARAFNDLLKAREMVNRTDPYLNSDWRPRINIAH